MDGLRRGDVGLDRKHGPACCHLLRQRLQPVCPAYNQRALHRQPQRGRPTDPTGCSSHQGNRTSKFLKSAHDELLSCYGMCAAPVSIRPRLLAWKR